MRKLLVTAAINLFIIYAGAQQDSSLDQLDYIIQDKIEDIASASDIELDYSTLLDQLNYYKEHPLNLNTASREELEALSLLNPLQVEALLKHIEDNGKLIALEELQTIDGFDLQDIYRMLPYVKISGSVTNERITLKRLAEEGQCSLMLRYQQVLETAKGFTAKNPEANDTSRYLGSKAKIYTQFRYRIGSQLSFGITGQKDAGEQFFKGSQPGGFDFYSAHLYYHDNGLIKSIVLGDYIAQYGQGLTLGTGLTFGKSYDIMNIKKNGEGLHPYISTNENLYMRGGAISVGSRKITLDLFYSNHNIDGNIAGDSAQEQYITALQTSGYHRTYAELQDKHSLGEMLYGGHFQYKQRNLNLGITAFEMQFDHNLQKTVHPYNQFQFNGERNNNLGFDYNYIRSNINWFGEIARSRNGAVAYLSGALINLDPRLGVSILYRNYDKEYQNLFCNAISENSGDANENGLIMGMVTRVSHSLALSCYYDQFSFPWLRYLVNAPSGGNEYIVQLTFNPAKTFEAYIRVRTKNKQGDLSADTHPISNMVDISQDNYRFNVKYAVSKLFTLSNRVEYVTYVKGGSQPASGFLISQDIHFKPLSSKLSFSLRYAIFDADSYYSRIYAYENDLLNAYSIPFLYNRGSRFYVLMHYRIFRNVEGYLRYAVTVYDNVTSISSGLDEINGNKKSDIGAQLRILF